MKNFSKLIVMILTVLMLSLSCGDTKKGYELALITDVGTIDDRSFNQGSWEGLKKYADEKNITHKYYQPTEKTTDAYIDSIDLRKILILKSILFFWTEALKTELIRTLE